MTDGPDEANDEPRHLFPCRIERQKGRERWTIQAGAGAVVIECGAPRGEWRYSSTDLPTGTLTIPDAGTARAFVETIAIHLERPLPQGLASVRGGELPFVLTSWRDGVSITGRCLKTEHGDARSSIVLTMSRGEVGIEADVELLAAMLGA